MASNYHFTILYFFTLFFKSLTATSNSSFSFNNLGQISTFDSVLALYGDAKAAPDSLSLQLTASLNSSVGRVIYKNPIKFYEGKPEKLVSFATYFSFSINSGSGLAFVVFSDGVLNGGKFNKFLGVEFDALMDDIVTLKVTNMSDVNLGLDSGSRLQVWIDYESNSRRLEVRLSKLGENRPVNPVRFEHIDLPKIYPGNEGFVVGLSSYNRNSSQVCNVYSWSFKTRRAPDWMHSEPLDPLSLKEKGNEVKGHKKSDCVMRILSALILGIGLGALGTFVGMFVWTIFGKRQPISPEDYAVKPVVVVVHDKASSNEKQ
ncbi:putative non-specific serine/threonine protein kinase [Helianthus annuus]|uniref:Non-specific serine/threonine protein kinase n=1 Tax=Helianthus annuus TaxID=4232 RepID=A0A251UIP1_HELAN|nr:L-type lectin-domain containing receptor kinase VIII.1 [Helianthus annuus]KAF5802263.1 putative non-specific serine/threonine protein kinase [Helianthus annuus]KAJ0560411.1 putative non-specific serine/threonine protein kinase [Helianthus annuus]KAJ0573441.1 putative non-specific serine/threonine protein kinase [Helianthus annuus]KAJ0740706.1 putative non-specific serine/threonine protein kinase [Helianthus annuus]KAJ0911759.1 putative non-specific serine/threonine protein kinase [Helianthu